MRADDIKNKYLKCKALTDNGQFDCGDQIAYEIEMDKHAITEAIEYIDSFIKYKNPVKTFGDASLLNARNLLEKRIKEFE